MYTLLTLTMIQMKSKHISVTGFIHMPFPIYLVYFKWPRLRNSASNIHQQPTCERDLRWYFQGVKREEVSVLNLTVVFLFSFSPPLRSGSVVHCTPVTWTLCWCTIHVNIYVFGTLVLLTVNERRRESREGSYGQQHFCPLDRKIKYSWQITSLQTSSMQYTHVYAHPQNMYVYV